MAYYLGLSILSTIRDTGNAHGMNARRILSQFEGRPIAENDIARTGQGRPFFPGREGIEDFNIAHSGTLTAVSCVKGKNLRTGCDVEQVRKRARAREIAEDFFSAAELNYIVSGGSFDEERFYRIWVLKECLLKLRGLSVFDMAACPSFIDDEENFTFGPDTAGGLAFPLSFYLYELTDGEQRYALASAIEGPEQQAPVIHWFSEASLTCKMIAEIKAAPSPADTVSPKM